MTTPQSVTEHVYPTDIYSILRYCIDVSTDGRLYFNEGDDSGPHVQPSCQSIEHCCGIALWELAASAATTGSNTIARRYTQHGLDHP